jgi:hypothetical protein
MTSEEQLAEWLRGNSLHNDELEECCPDFSCCQLILLAPLKEREAFVRAYLNNDQETKYKFLMTFLDRATKLAGGDKKVHITG